MSRNPVTSAITKHYRFVAQHPDGSVKRGDWTSKADANSAATEYAKGWLSSAKRLGLVGQRIKLSIQTRTQETRVFISKPSLTAEYSQVEEDRYGNVWGIK